MNTDLIKSVLPWIGTALGGPLGAGVASFVASKLGVPADTVSETLNAMVVNPEELTKVKELEYAFQQHMAEIGYQNVKDLEELNTRNVEAVNKTMQVEAGSEHWPTWGWRPAIGFAVAFNLISSSLVIFIAYMFKADIVGNLPAMLTAQAGLNATALPILGISSYFRGKMQADPSIPATTQIPFSSSAISSSSSTSK